MMWKTSTCVVAVLGVLHVEAATIVDDQFNDGSVGNGTNAAETDIAWSAYSTSKLGLSVNTDAVMAGNVLVYDTKGSFPAAVGVFVSSTAAGSGLELPTVVGQKIRLSFDFRWVSPSVSSSELRVGLYNNNGSTNANNDFGYRIGLSQGGGTGTILVEQGGNAGPAEGNDTVSLGARSTAGSSVPALSNTLHTFVYELTRNSATEIGISGSLDGNVFRTATHVAGDPSGSGALITRYHSIVIGAGNQSSNDLRIDNVVLQTIIPEPGGLAFTALAAVPLLRRRRRIR